MKELAIRPSRSPVLWFFATTFVLTAIGHGVHLYVSHRLSIGVPSGTPIFETPVWIWSQYAPYITGTGPSIAGLLMILYLYGRPGLRRLAFQLGPWSVGNSWRMLVVCLLLPLGVIVLPIGMLAAAGAPVSTPHMPGPDYLIGAIVGGFIGTGNIRGTRLARFRPAPSPASILCPRQ